MGDLHPCQAPWLSGGGSQAREPQPRMGVLGPRSLAQHEDPWAQPPLPRVGVPGSNPSVQCGIPGAEVGGPEPLSPAQGPPALHGSPGPKPPTQHRDLQPSRPPQPFIKAPSPSLHTGTPSPAEPPSPNVGIPGLNPLLSTGAPNPPEPPQVPSPSVPPPSSGHGGRGPPEAPLAAGVLLALQLLLALPLLLGAQVQILLLQVPHRGPAVPLKVRLVLCGDIPGLRERRGPPCPPLPVSVPVPGDMNFISRGKRRHTRL